MNADCQRWCTLSDRAAAGEPLASEEETFVEAHVGSCRACAAEGQIWSALGQVLSEPEQLTRQVVVAAERPSLWRLGAGLSGGGAAAGVVARRWALLAAAAGAVFAVGSGLALLRKNQSEKIRVAPPPAPASVVLTSGEVELHGTQREVLAGELLSQGDVLQVGAGRACLHVSASLVCVGDNTKLTLSTSTVDEQVLLLESGELVAQVQKRSAGQRFVVETPRGSVSVEGTVFAVSVAEDGPVGVRVAQGAVVVGRRGQEKRLVEASEAVSLDENATVRAADPALLERDAAWMSSAVILGGALSCRLELQTTPSGAETHVDGDLLGVTPLSVTLPCGKREIQLRRPGFTEHAREITLRDGIVRQLIPLDEAPVLPPEPEPRAAAASPTSSAAELLAAARAHRNGGRYADAAAAYRRLTAQHRGSPEASTALVALGELELSQLGDAAGALRSFDAYVKQGGGLLPEARYGRIRALRELGRHAEEQEAIARFVRDYPTSVQAAQLESAEPQTAGKRP